MKSIEVSKATAPLAEYAHDVESEPLILTEGGVPVAALMAIADADLETVALGSDPRFMALIEQARAQQKAGADLSVEEVRREIGLS